MTEMFDIHNIGVAVDSHHEKFMQFLKERFQWFVEEDINPDIFVDVSFDNPVFEDSQFNSLGDGVAIHGNELLYETGPLTIHARLDNVLSIDLNFSPMWWKHIGRLAKKGRRQTWNEYFEYYLIRRGIQLPMFWIMQREGFYPVHASAVAHDGKAHVFTGTAGSGKTTLSLALSEEGYTLLGDNFVFFKDGKVYPYPEMLRVTDFTLETIDSLEPSTRKVFGQSIVNPDDFNIGTEPRELESLVFIDRGPTVQENVANPVDRLLALADVVGEFHTHHFSRMFSYISDTKLVSRDKIYEEACNNTNTFFLRYEEMETVKEAIK